MKNIVIFDQDLQLYRQEIYKYFNTKFIENGYKIDIFYDKALNEKNSDSFFHSIDYSYSKFKEIVSKKKPVIVIQFVWLRYKFLIPFMLWCRFKKIKIAVWSHGINLQKKDQKLRNLLYYLRQFLANSLIIYNNDQKQYILFPSKTFVANNTLNFNSFPNVTKNKSELKKLYQLENKRIILTVGRMNVNNRKVEHLIKLAGKITKDFLILIVGSGLTFEQKETISKLDNIKYLGVIYDDTTICELYKMADLFVMPGAIGLSINQAFYFETPVIIENVYQGPEAFYLKENVNGYYYNKNDIDDLLKKINLAIQTDNYDILVKNTKEYILNIASPEKMFDGFLKAIDYAIN